MKLNLPNNVSSHQDLQTVILEIRRYAQWFAQTTVKQRLLNSGSYEPLAISQAAVDLIKLWAEEKPTSQKSLDELIATLKDLEATALRITIILAALPPSNLKKLLIAWCRENIGPNVLVDFQFNSTMLGGMVVRYGSHVYDWSFRRQILAARERFPEVLRSV